LEKIRPQIENQITMGKRCCRRVEVDDHQAFVMMKLEMGTLQCRIVLRVLQKEQEEQTLGKTNVVSVDAKPSIQVVVRRTRVVIMHSIWCDKG
jgi:hypothetical protein